MDVVRQSYVRVPYLSLLVIALSLLWGCAGPRVVNLNYHTPYFQPNIEQRTRISGYMVLPTGDMGTWRGIILLAHGGFQPGVPWLGLGETLARRTGYLVLIPDYRGEGLSDGKIEFASGEVEDMRAALNYARSAFFFAAKKGEVDVRLIGVSHGGFNTLLFLSRPPDFPVKDENFGLHEALKVSKAAIFAGGYDFVRCYQRLKDQADADTAARSNRLDDADDARELVYALENHFLTTKTCPAPVTPKSCLEAFTRRSAKTYADRFPMDVQYLFVHGTQDKTVNVEESDEVTEMLRLRGASYEYHRIDGMGHYPEGLFELLRSTAPIMDFIVSDTPLLPRVANRDGENTQAAPRENRHEFF